MKHDINNLKEWWKRIDSRCYAKHELCLSGALSLVVLIIAGIAVVLN